MAFQVRNLMIAAAGLLLLQVGWRVLDLALVRPAGVTPEALASVETIAQSPESLAFTWRTVERLTDRLFEPARALTTPLARLLAPDGSWIGEGTRVAGDRLAGDRMGTGRGGNRADRRRPTRS